MPVSEIIISQGRNQYKVNLQDKPIWFVLMWGWWPNGGDAPSYRWQKVDKVPLEIEEEFKRCGEVLLQKDKR